VKTTDADLLAKAHALLDQVKAGHYVKPWLITQALRLTGDLERAGKPILRICSRPKCNGTMEPGVAIEQTYGGVPDLGEVVTVSQRGPGRLIRCMKCNICGHSVTV
jgi:hypothetical protein